MDYNQALSYLDKHTNLEGNRADRFSPSLPVAGQVDGLSLDSMAELVAALGDPQDAFRSIHITGTNGKGSTARITSALLSATGLSVGLYTSPNLVRVNERIRWHDRDISDEEFAQVMGLLASVEPLLSATPSRFELLTAAAFVWFAEIGVEVAVIEVGLLGRYDATNVVDADVAVVTNIGKDHTDGAEGWQDVVAGEKAGIVKPDSRVVIGADLGPLRRHIEAEPNAGIWAAGRDFAVVDNQLAVGGRVIDLVTPNERYDHLFVPFHGRHQGDNAATAIVAVEAFFDRALDREVIDEALGAVQIPARFEIVGRDPLIIVDGAHNPHGAQAVRATLDEEFAPLGSRVLVIGMLTGKSIPEMLEAIGVADFDAVICTQAHWSRAVPASEIAEAAAALGVTAEVVPEPLEAVQRALAVTAEDDLILVCGSFYVVGEVHAALKARFDAGVGAGAVDPARDLFDES